MEQQLSETLDNILGLLLLEGSYNIEEADEFMKVSIDTPDAARLIGVKGESLDSLQLLVNQILAKKAGEAGFKKVIFDVGGWRAQKQEDLEVSAKKWAEEVLSTGKEMELEPQPSWQRRIVHEIIGQVEGVETESIGEGRDRHIMIKLKTQNSKLKTKASEVKSEEA